MATLLKVDEWKSASGNYYVADVHTWKNWRHFARILDREEDVEAFSEYLRTKRGAIVDGYYPDKDFLMFHWKDYGNAHQFKLDVNRIARKKNYLV